MKPSPRSFLKGIPAAVAVWLVSATAAVADAPPAEVDLLLTGGRVLDGAGNDWVYRDIGINGDRIAYL